MANVAGICYLAAADKARRELGWQARSVEDGMRETVAWLKSDR
jgi:nucleoside-diphosphate-sugar epimerase